MLKFKGLSIGLLSVFLFSAQSPSAQEAPQAQGDSDKKQLSASNTEAEKIRAEKIKAAVDDLLGDLSAVSPSK